MTTHLTGNLLKSCLYATLLSLTLFFSTINMAEAASLSLSPATGVYATGATFSVNVMVNTSGKSINASDGTLSFNPQELAVVSVGRTGSIFNLWVAEPAFSNSAGTISFSGGSPSGYSGAGGNVMTVTFKALGSGTARVSLTKGSVLANDGKGTNVLTGMNGGVYTIQAKTTAPEPERIVEYVAPANTPPQPIITSSSHPNEKDWYATPEAQLSWKLPPGITAVRTLVDDRPTTIPTKVYEPPISTLTLSDLSQGESYFHLQFKNADGWGKVAHYRLAVDSEKPTSISIELVPGANLANPNQSLIVKVDDETSLVRKFMVRVDANEPFEYIDESGSSTIPLTALAPGYHTVIIEAFDQAGNGIIGTHSFTIEAFEKPYFTEYPNQINEEVIPVIKGQTRANSLVRISLQKIGGEPTVSETTSNETGAFVFIPSGTFSTGVYEISARAIDEFGAESAESDKIRIAVEQPGYLKVGNIMISVLSVLVPLLGLVVLLAMLIWYIIASARRLKKKVSVESREALTILEREFAHLEAVMRESEADLMASRKTNKLTIAEGEFVAKLREALKSSKQRVLKEAKDVVVLVEKEADINS